MIFSIFMLLSGQLIPVSLLPAWIQQTSRLLPFESIYYIPARIYAAPSLSGEVMAMLAQQVVWVMVMGVVTSLLWSRGISRYASQGG